MSSSKFELNINGRSMYLQGFDPKKMENIFTFCNNYFQGAEDLPKGAEKIKEIEKNEQGGNITTDENKKTVTPIVVVDKKQDFDNPKLSVSDVKMPHELIPHVLSFDDLQKFMIQAFPHNKIDTNLQNCRVLKQLFTTHLKMNHFNINVLKNSRQVLESIRERIHTAQKSILSAVSKSFQMYLMITPQEYIQQMKELTDLIEAEMKKRVFNTKEEENMISDTEIKNVMDKYRDSTDLQGKQFYLILQLYTEMEPLRLDYVNMIVSDTTASETENYINLSTGHIFLRKYKTSSSYGEKIIKLPDHILETVKELLKYRRDVAIVSDYLFINPSNFGPMTKSSFVKNINSIFGKHVSVNILRKRWVSTHIDAERVEREEEMANKMCHSVDVQKLVYCKRMNKKA